MTAASRPPDDTPLGTAVASTSSMQGRTCEHCGASSGPVKGKPGKAISRYLGQWLCFGCAKKTFGNRHASHGNRLERGNR
jgi:hypothetical protein